MEQKKPCAFDAIQCRTMSKSFSVLYVFLLKNCCVHGREAVSSLIASGQNWEFFEKNFVTFTFKKSLNLSPFCCFLLQAGPLRRQLPPEAEAAAEGERMKISPS